MVKRKTTSIQFQFTKASTSDLRGKQSVRTTFKLTERSIEALSILSTQLGIKQKSLFDHLVEDTKTLRHLAQKGSGVIEGESRVPKTYVISRRSLENLEKISGKYDTPRDILVEYCVKRILPLIEQEKEKHKKRKKLLSEVQKFFEDGCKLFDDVEDLGYTDPASLEIESMIRAVRNSRDNISKWVERGSKIEEF